MRELSGMIFGKIGSIRRLLGIVAVILIASATAAWAHGTLDQQSIDTTDQFEIFVEDPIAQTFKPAANNMVSASVYLSDCGGPDSTSDITMYIRKASAPYKVLAKKTVSVPPGTNGWVHYDLPSKLSLTMNKTYVLQMKKVFLDSSWCWHGNVTYGPYPRGIMILKGVQKPDGDLAFKTYKQ